MKLANTSVKMTGALLLALAAWSACAHVRIDPSLVVTVADRRGEPALSGMDFSGPREAWHRLAQALRRGDRATAMQQLTPAAQERYAAVIDRWIASRPFNEARFGQVRSVTLSGVRYATVTLSRKKDTGTYGAEAMLMRDEQGRWRIDRMPQD